MSTSTSQPVSLATSFALLAEETMGSRAKRQLNRISDQLASGTSLNDAISQSSTKIAPPLRELLALSAKGNVDIHESLTLYADYNRKQSVIYRQLLTSLFYPVVLLLALLFYLNLYAHCALPTVEELYLQFNGPPRPGYGESYPLIISFYQLIRATWLPQLLLIPLSIVAFFVFQWAIRHITPFRYVVNHLPIIGNLFRFPPLAIFCRYLSLLVKHDVPLPAAIRIASEQSSDPSLKRDCLFLANVIEKGTSPGAVASVRQAIPAFPGEFMQTFQWAESSESFSLTLAAAGDIFDSYTQTQTNLIPWLVIPWVGGLLIATVLFTEIAFFYVTLKGIGGFL